MRISARSHGPTSRALGALLAFCAATALAACASTSDKSDADKANLIQMQPDDPIGKFLADLDKTVVQWSNLTLTASTAAEQREARVLESVLVERTSKRRDDLIKELEGGPPINRIRAAAALGFTRAVEAQSPLLAALEDTNPDVVHNALLGLAVLGRGDTPLEPICKLLERSPDSQTRAQAAWAMRAIVGAGGTGDTVLTTARRALVDTEPFVRTECALTLGILADKDSVPALGDALYDTAQLASRAAGEALVLIAKKEPSQKGPVGRKLVEALNKGDSRLARRAKEALVQVSDVNYGDDVKLWTEWAKRLP
jgi:HEAT repeat protein